MVVANHVTGNVPLDTVQAQEFPIAYLLLSVEMVITKTGKLVKSVLKIALLVNLLRTSVWYSVWLLVKRVKIVMISVLLVWIILIIWIMVNVWSVMENVIRVLEAALEIVWNAYSLIGIKIIIVNVYKDILKILQGNANNVLKNAFLVKEVKKIVKFLVNHLVLPVKIMIIFVYLA